MAGTVDLVQRCYTGIETRDGAIWFNPCLPDDIGCIELRLRYHGRWLDVIGEREKLRLCIDTDAIGPIRFGFEDRIYEVQPGECRDNRAMRACADRAAQRKPGSAHGMKRPTPACLGGHVIRCRLTG